MRNVAVSQLSIAAASLKQVEESSESSGEELDQMGVPDFYNQYAGDDPTIEGGDNEDDEVPMITVDGCPIPLINIDDSIIRRMNQE